ncbi:hypothetical protein MRX96_000321 [Rhipicephalus microplus]
MSVVTVQQLNNLDNVRIGMHCAVRTCEPHLTPNETFGRGGNRTARQLLEACFIKRKNAIYHVTTYWDAHERSTHAKAEINLNCCMCCALVRMTPQCSIWFSLISVGSRVVCLYKHLLF